MTTTQVEYVDFAATEAVREYRLRVRQGADVHHVTVAIPNEAFLSGRVRYQDAPDICFLKIQREIADAGEGAVPAPALEMTDQELEEYKIAHTPKSNRRG
jgi:hypothetical protein